MNNNNNIHFVMLGDSVFDNGSYIPGEPAVEEQVSEQLKFLYPDATLTFKARDGAVMSDVLDRQIQLIPEEATHIALSIGGNDLLDLRGNLGDMVGTRFQENLIFLSKLKQEFAEKFRRVINNIDSLGIPFTVCTIYYAGSIVETGEKRIDLGDQLGFAGTDVVVDAFDAAITQVSQKAENCKEIIDLRILFDNTNCYANPIEPSCIGGEKITDQLMGFIQMWSNG